MMERNRVSHKWSIAAAWAVAISIGVFAAFFRGGAYQAQLILLTVGLVALMTGLLQLIVADKDGFIVRISLSIAGALFFLGATTTLLSFAIN